MSEWNRGCLGFLFSIFGGRAESGAAIQTLPKVQVNRYFVSNAEGNFFRVLKHVVGQRAHVLAQVSLRQLVWFPGNNQSNPGRAIWQNKVAAKAVDFVVCDPATLRPLVVIELDDSTHSRPDRQTRDAEIEALLRAAGLPLLHVRTSRAYNTQELFESLRPYLPSAAP
ncbi:DUF2726 domain-containing protein [Fontivita pretiosa]|uniref:DUF2726 domain-containing protein n=1 Tax=Fontivita pretiosa TaxID=2989684 RepID=UPI003D17B9C3